MAGFKTVIDVVDSALGEKLSEKMLQTPERLDLGVRRRIANAYRAFEVRPDFDVPEAESGEVFPFVHPRWIAADRFGDFGADLTSEDTLLEVERNIKKTLLYYHRIALPCGFAYFCDYYVNGEPPENKQREQFLAYLRFYARLRPLMEKGIVLFLPSVPSTSLAQDAVAAQHPRYEQQAIIDRLLPDNPYFPLRRIVEESLWIGARFNLDLFLPGKPASDFFDLYSKLQGTPLATTRLEEATAGSLLLQCRLPNIDKLKLSEMIRVRESGDGFAEWRSSLRHVVAGSYRDLLQGRFDPHEMRRLASDEFAGAREKVEQEVKKYTPLGLAKQGVRSVGIGFGAGLVSAGLWTNPATLARTVAITAGTTFLWDYFSGLPKRRRAGAMKAHYAVWSDATSVS